MIRNRSLLATCWTSAGCATPFRGDEPSPLDLRARIEAVGLGGWKGFGLLHTDLAVAVNAVGLPDMRRMFDDNGIEHVELELLRHWWSHDQRRVASDRLRYELLDAAAALGAKTIKIGAETDGASVDMDAFYSEFDRLATQAGNAGTRVAIEPMPMDNLQSLRGGIELVTGVANMYGGLVVDIWHINRAGTSYDEVRATLPVEYTFMVELSDAGVATDNLWDDTINHRLLPGQGTFDVPSFIAAVASTGYAGLWGVEVLSNIHRRKPVGVALKDARDATLAALRDADLKASASSDM